MKGPALYLPILTLAFILPALQWIVAVDLTALPRQWSSLPPGQSFYLAAKLLGMLAMSIAVVQVGLSALSRARLIRMNRADHRVLGALITLLVLAHVVCFVTGVSIRNGHITWHLLAPDLTNGSYNRGVGTGVIGFWLLLCGVAVAVLKGRFPPILHRLALIGCGLGLIHAVWIGTEKTYVWALVAVFAAIFTGAAWGRRRRAA